MKFALKTTILASALILAGLPAISSAADTDMSNMTCQQMMDKTKPMMDKMTDSTKMSMAQKEMDSAKMAMDKGKMDDCKMHMKKAMDMSMSK